MIKALFQTMVFFGFVFILSTLLAEAIKAKILQRKVVSSGKLLVTPLFIRWISHLRRIYFEWPDHFIPVIILALYSSLAVVFPYYGISYLWSVRLDILVLALYLCVGFFIKILIRLETHNVRFSFDKINFILSAMVLFTTIQGSLLFAGEQSFERLANHSWLLLKSPFTFFWFIILFLLSPLFEMRPFKGEKTGILSWVHTISKIFWFSLLSFIFLNTSWNSPSLEWLTHLLQTALLLATYEIGRFAFESNRTKFLYKYLYSFLVPSHFFLLVAVIVMGGIQ